MLRTVYSCKFFKYDNIYINTSWGRGVICGWCCKGSRTAAKLVTQINVI